MSSTNNDKRIDWIDCSKGITILLVIFGHTISSGGSQLEQVLRGGIFSFHMPLFFILSCITFKLSTEGSQFVKKTEKACRHLVFTALILYGLRTLVNIVNNFHTIEWKGYIAEKINVLVYGSGSNVIVSGTVIPAFGMMWFFVVLFWGRTLFDYLHLKLKKIKFIVAILMSTMIGIVLGCVQWLPLSFDVALVVMPFFWFGDYLKHANLNRKRAAGCIVSLLIWGITFAMSYFIKNDYMELAGRRYPLFPLCYITAMAGTMFICYFSQYMLMLGGLAKPLVYIGRNSIYLYCVHAMDYVYGFIWSRTNSNIVNGMIRIVADVFMCVILVRVIKLIPLLRMRNK
ncbi:hypothetical protein D7V94_19055 [Parablautia intestinalis]|uniref:Acyltransferase 3 domain-containing protein n=1 Tax=Parablautia intestinalis TaxID=2320100 RepID=A0A3A9AN02_9FIRM|nr:acyltransferase family protein [Parablautia intestinalis]RKI88676.1 hypothetical protein D7V94_19055 [Parablautia intestinalis]